MNQKQNVITHQGRTGTVDLCAEHEDAYRDYIGIDYLGVARGAHQGRCEECQRVPARKTSYEAAIERLLAYETDGSNPSDGRRVIRQDRETLMARRQQHGFGRLTQAAEAEALRTLALWQAGR